MATLAVLLAAVTLATPVTIATRADASETGRCQTSTLTATGALNPKGASSGSDYFYIVLHNQGPTSCRLTGFPGVSALNAGGHQVGNPATWVRTGPTQTITVPPHQAAHAVLQVGRVANYPPNRCRPGTVNRLRVYPPNNTQPRLIAFTLRVCSNPKVSNLSVRAFEPGTGLGA